MKIFNWVHRKFSNKENVENKSGSISVTGGDDQLWSGGILTIGTFGYDPLKELEENHHHNNHVSSFYEEEDESGKKQLAVVEYDQHHQSDTDDSEDEEEEVDQNNEEEEEEEEEEKPLVFAAYAQDLIMEGNYQREFEYVMMEKKERITLADLFSADHEEKNVHNSNNVINMKGGIIKDKANCKHGFSSFRKKLILEDARPIHKLHQIMRRMMRRKIHPDVSPLNNSKVSVKKCEANDNASLLSTQDATI